MVDHWNASDEQLKIENIERWDQQVYRPNQRPTPSLINGESYDQQRKRIMNGARSLVSDELQKVRTEHLFETALDHVERQFIASAASEAVRPTRVADGELQQVISHDEAGRPSYSFYGSPRAWLNNFAAPRKKLVGIMSPGARNITIER
jgi:hypothetical protein